MRKLEQFTRLPPQERQALELLGQERTRDVAARQDIVREGDRPTSVTLILSGWACRHKMLADGRRQIVAFLLPGDLGDLNFSVLRRMDHAITAITPVTVAEVAHGAMERLMGDYARVTRALLWDQLVAAAIQREWTVNLGQRSAFERIAHLLCELFLRLRGVGLADEQCCELPLTQAELAEAAGLTMVHANRMLQELRSQGLIVLRRRTLTIPDLAALQAAAQFDAQYLHLDHEGREHDAPA